MMTGSTKHHDLVAVGVMRAKLAALIRIKTAFKQRPENRWVDLAPVQTGGLQHLCGILLVKGQRLVGVKEAAIEPFDMFKPHPTA